MRDGSETMHGLWRQLVESARDAYVSIDRDGRVTEWNSRAEALFGWSREEALGGLLAETIVPPELRDAHLLGLQRFVATGEGKAVFQRLQLPALHRSGRRLEVEFTIWPSRGPDGDWRFHAFLHDIGVELRQQGYVHLLQQVAIAANEATSVEAAVRGALDAARAATGLTLGHAYVAEVGANGSLAPTGWWSPAPREPFSSETAANRFADGDGLPGRVAATRRATWIERVSRDANFPRAEAAVASGLEAAFAFPVIVGSDVVGVLELFSDEPAEPDPQLLEVMEAVGTQLGRVFERQLALQELRTAAEEREAIVSIVGHELRGPLAASHAASSLLGTALGDTDNEDAQRILGMLDRQLGRLRRMVDNLLTAQRLDAGSLTVHAEPTPVAPIVRQVVSDAPFPDVDILGEEDATALADPDHLTQILWNLFANSMEHGQPPTSVTSRRSNGALRIEVRDAGEGVSEESLPKLFNRFTRGGGSRGSGLGLAIARGLARANGGDVSYDADAEDGWAFVIDVPAAP